MKQELGHLIERLEQFKMNKEDEEYCTVRNFALSGRKLVNRGDSFKVKKSTSGHSIAPVEQSGIVGDPPANPLSPAPYRIAVLGAPAVGKSALISQFMTSEDFLHCYDGYSCDRKDKTVTVLLDKEESELTFTDLPFAILQRRGLLEDVHGFCVVYSVTDRLSFHQAQLYLQQLESYNRAVILVANKIDLARSRVVTEQEGRMLATASNCKYIESSVAINHQVDTLLVGLLVQIRLRAGLVSSSGGRKRKYRGSKTSASFRGLLGKLRIAKSNSCHKLHVL